MNTPELNKLKRELIIPLISAAAVMRKDSHLRKLLKHSKDIKLNPAKIYEALLQTYLFSGFPSALQSLKIFHEFFNADYSVEKYDLNKFMSVGKLNCKKIYGNKFDKLIKNIKAFSPHLSEWLIIEGYGKTLGRKQLGMKDRELCIVSILTALKYEEQLFSHLIGAIKLGNSIELIRESLKNLHLIGGKNKAEWGLKILQKVTTKNFPLSKLHKRF